MSGERARERSAEVPYPGFAPDTHPAAPSARRSALGKCALSPGGRGRVDRRARNMRIVDPPRPQIPLYLGAPLLD